MNFNAITRFVPRRFRKAGPVVPVIRLAGAIGMAMPLRPGLSLASAAPLIERAFSMPGAAAVAIVINSPGGSAAQSHLIFKRIRAFAEEKSLPVIAFVEDAAASGGYMIACAADEIFADPSSIVGSIGVVSSGFGFDKLIARYGIERRVHTAGENKAMLDPFQPENPDDVARLKDLQHRIHLVFKALVESRRGPRLARRDDLFSGAFWVGAEALEMGLIDGLGDLREVMRRRLGDKVELRMIAPPRSSLVGRLLGPRGAQNLIDPDRILGAVEERGAWARIGL